MRLARVWKPCVLPSVTTTEFPSLLSPLEYVGGSDASLSIQARIFDAISIFEPLLALLLHATLTGRKLIAWATVERVLVIFQRSPRPEIVPESSNIGTAATGRECFSTTKRWKSATSCASSSFLSKFYILFLFLLVPRIDRFLDLFQKLDESGARWIEYETCERVSEWVRCGERCLVEKWSLLFSILVSYEFFQVSNYIVFSAQQLSITFRFDFILSKFSSENTHYISTFDESRSSYSYLDGQDMRFQL